MKNSSRIRTIAALLGMAAAGLLYGQSSKAPDYRTNDGIFATPKTVTFSRDKDIYLRQYLGDGKDASFYALDPLVILKGKINYLEENGAEVRKQYTPAARQREIAYCKTLLIEISKEKRDEKYFQDLKRLENAVSDGTITTDEMKGLESNVTFGIGERSKIFDAPMLTHFTEAQSNAGTGYQVQIQQSAALPDIKSEIVTGTSENNTGNGTPDASLMTPKPGQASEKQPLPAPETPKEPEKKKSGLLPVSFIFGANYSGNNNAVGAGLGLRFGYNENPVNVAITGNYQRGLSNDSSFQSVTTTDPVSPAGLYGVNTVDTTTNNSNFNSFGGDISCYLGNEKARMILGGGYRHLTYDWAQTQNHTSQVKREDLVVGQNNYSENSSGQGIDNLVRFYVGFDLGLGAVRPEFTFGLEHSLTSGKNNVFVDLRSTLFEPSKYKN